jgi:uncharacterized membrane protein
MNSFNRIRLILLILAIMLSVANVVVCFTTIPGSAVMTSPSMYLKMKVPYALSIVILFFLPLASLSLSFLFGIIPFKMLRYGQRVSLIFVSILLVVEGIGLYQLIMESYTY